MYVREICTKKDVCETCSQESVVFDEWNDIECLDYEFDMGLECPAHPDVEERIIFGVPMNFCKLCGKEARYIKT